MAYNHEYPYVDPNRYNSDWILNKIKELMNEMNTFVALNKITFSGEWDITKQYPAWTIVNDNNGRDGYISIQPVPAGVTIDNVDYWRAVANYSDLIADLQNRVIALEEENAFRYRDPEVICIGDSFLQQTENWGKYLKTRMGVTDATKWHESGVPAVGFYDNHFTDQLQAVVNGLTDPENVTHIVVIGGTNDVDAGTITSVNDGITSFLALAKRACPYAKVYVGFVCTRFGSGYYQTDSVYNKALCYRYYERNAAENGAVFIPHLTESLFTSGRLKSDLVHPTEEGAAILADIIAGAVNGTNFSVPARYESATLTLTAQSGALTYSLSAGREHTKFMVDGLGITGLVITPNTWLSILTYDELPIKPSIMHIEQALVRLNTAGLTDFTFVHASIQLSVNGLRIRFDNNDTAPSGTKNLTILNCPVAFDLMPIV